MLAREIDSPQLDLMDPIFDARLGVGVLSVCVDEFRGDSVKFETFEMQKPDDVTLPQIPVTDTFQFLTFGHGLFAVIFHGGNSKFVPDPSPSWGY
jgi:hypothetical protein